MAENKMNFVNFVNNNEFSLPLSPNNNSTNGVNGFENSHPAEISCHLENTIDNDTNNNRNQTGSDCGKQFIQEMSTEL